MLQVSLSEDQDLARRIAFVTAKVASRFGLPTRSRSDDLLQCAMDKPEAVTPEEFSVLYAMRDLQ